MDPTATFADRIGSRLDAARVGVMDYERLLTDDLSQLGRAFAWRAGLAVVSLILLTGAVTMAGVSVLLSTSLDAIDWRERPATWAVPLAFLGASIVAALLALYARRRPPMAATRARLSQDADHFDRCARSVAQEAEDRLAPLRRMWTDVASMGVVGTASAGVRHAAHDWWQRQPIQPAVSSVARDVHEVIDPIARSHPWVLVGSAAAAGGVIALLLPRRWLRRIDASLRASVAPWLAALGPALTAKVLAGFDLGSLASMLASTAPAPGGSNSAQAQRASARAPHEAAFGAGTAGTAASS